LADDPRKPSTLVEGPGPAPAQGTVRETGAERERRRWFLVLAVLLGLLYALLQNGLWTPGNDSEFYLVTARNILAGRGYVFNGVPFGHYPPGWPLFLAGLMSISRSFWFLNAAAKLLLIGAALLHYQVLSRYTTPRRAFACVALSATLWFWFRFGYALYSESLFLCLVGAGLLVALQLREGARPGWRILVLALLCAAMALTRWVGLITCGVVGLTAASGSVLPRWNARWLSFMTCVAVGIGVFAALSLFTLRRARSTAAAQQDVLREEIVEDTTGQVGEAAGILTRKVRRLRSFPRLRERGLGEYAERIAYAGIWISQMLWPVALLGARSALVRHFFNILGWCLWVPWVVFAVRRLKKRDWLWAGMMVYAGFFTLAWSAKGRYLIPFAPLWILGIWGGMEMAFSWLARRFSRRWAKAGLFLKWSFLILIVLGNGVTFASAVRVQRSSDYYRKFRGGQLDELVRAGYLISRRAPPDGKIVVDLRRAELSTTTPSRLGLSAMVFLTDRPVIATVSWSRGEWKPTEEFLHWARRNNVVYFLFRPPTSPWRIWHFRVPWLQRMVTGKKEIPRNPDWVLYRIDGEDVERVALPPVRGWPRRVPPVVGAGAGASGG